MTKGLHKDSLRKVDNPHQWMIDDARMELIQQIKAEVERLYDEANNYDDSRHYLGEVLSVLSDLETETTYDTHQYTPRPSVGIEDVARVQFASHAKIFDKKRKAVFDWEQFKEVAGIFYGFGKKDHSDTLEKSEMPINPVIEKLRAEVERLYDGEAPAHDQQCDFDDGYFTGIGAISKFLDTLQEQPVCEGLEEEIERYLHSLGVGYGGWVDGMEDDDLRGIARHFAKWGAEHLKK